MLAAGWLAGWPWPPGWLALSNKMGGARLLPAMAKTAGAPGYGGRASGPKERAMLQPWVMVS
jgi:hypothetical protein